MTYRTRRMARTIVVSAHGGGAGRCASHRQQRGGRHGGDAERSGHPGRAHREVELPAGRPPERAAAELTPSERRDSILLPVRAPAVLDSLKKAGYDTNAIRTVRTQVSVLTNPAGALGGGLVVVAAAAAVVAAAVPAGRHATTPRRSGKVSARVRLKRRAVAAAVVVAIRSPVWTRRLRRRLLRRRLHPQRAVVVVAVAVVATRREPWATRVSIRSVGSGR